MAKYTGDANLIKGAAAAYKNYDNMPGMYQGLDELVDAGLQQSKEAIKGLEEKKKENDNLVKDFEKNANKTVQQAGSLSDVIFNDTYKQVTALKERAQKAISNGNDEEYQNTLRELSALSLEIQDHKATRKDLSELMTDPDVSYSKSMLENGGDELFYLNQVMANKYSKGDRDGETVYNLKDRSGKTVSFTNAELKDMYIPENVGFQLEYGKASTRAKQDEVWGGDAFRSSIRQSIGKTLTELRSVLTDSKGDLNLKKLLENDIGLDKEILSSISGWDADNDGVVDPDEKANLIDAIVNYKNENFNEDITRLIIEEKLTEAGRTKHAAYWASKNELNGKIPPKIPPKGGGSTSDAWFNTYKTYAEQDTKITSALKGEDLYDWQNNRYTTNDGGATYTSVVDNDTYKANQNISTNDLLSGVQFGLSPRIQILNPQFKTAGDEKDGDSKGYGIEVMSFDDKVLKKTLEKDYLKLKVNKDIDDRLDAGIEVIEIVAENGAKQVIYLQGDKNTDKAKELIKLNEFLEKNAESVKTPKSRT